MRVVARLSGTGGAFELRIIAKSIDNAELVESTMSRTGLCRKGTVAGAVRPIREPCSVADAVIIVGYPWILDSPQLMHLAVFFDSR